MTSSRHLLQLQIQIQELLPTLELFLEENSNINNVTCEHLQSQINALEERLAVFKYSLNSSVIESKIELVELPVEPEQAAEISSQGVIHPKIVENPSMENKIEEKVVEQKTEFNSRIIDEARNTVNLKPLSIGINDKFRFINELFAQNAPEYSVAIEQINSMTSINEASNYLSSLKNVYQWQENNETVKQFSTIVKKRYT
jgi:hypothetical protein